MLVNPYGRGRASGAFEALKKVGADYAGVTSQLAANALLLSKDPYIYPASLSKTGDYTGVNPTVNRFTVTAHGFGSAGEYVYLKYTSTTGNPIEGLTVGTVYRTKIVTANVLEFVTESNATIDLTGPGSGTHTFTPRVATTNSTAIGTGAAITASNQVVLGNSSVTEIKFGGAGNHKANSINIPTSKTPTTGIAGDICWDAAHLYVCVATDTWLPIPLDGVFGALSMAALSVSGTLPTGTLASPPSGLVAGDVWADTTDSATHPVLRVMA